MVKSKDHHRFLRLFHGWHPVISGDTITFGVAIIRPHISEEILELEGLNLHVKTPQSWLNLPEPKRFDNVSLEVLRN